MDVESAKEFIQDRITALRIQKGVSEYKMSLDLGHAKGYIQNISSKKALPSVTELLYICDYFEITPQEFFDTSLPNPILLERLNGLTARMNEKDLSLMIGIAERLTVEQNHKK